MNPLVSRRVVDRAFEEDPTRALSEYGRDGEIAFRSDIELFLPREIAESAVVPSRFELPPTSGFRYRAFVDPSGGSADSFTLAIAHAEEERVVLDLVRERRPPFSPEAVVQEFSELVRSYGEGEVVGDRYAGEWPREQFRKNGVSYSPSERDRSAIYLELVPLLMSQKIELLDNPRLIHQLVGLERRTSRSGRDSVDHAPGAHDDLINAAAGALGLAKPIAGARIRRLQWG
jgi:hypothetical protein